MIESPLSTATQGRGSRKDQGWCVPKSIQSFGGKLMTQQVWCWGRDVECDEGNLLMRFGFERHRDCDTEERSTCYRFDRDELHVALWGFGMFFGNRELGGLYLNRFEFRPLWAPVESVSLAIHWPDELPIFDRPQGKSQWQRARKLWQASQNWIANYEAWVVESIGLDYRRACVESWLRPYVRHDKISTAWKFLGRRGWEQQQSPLAKTLQQYTISARLR